MMLFRKKRQRLLIDQHKLLDENIKISVENEGDAFTGIASKEVIDGIEYFNLSVKNLGFVKGCYKDYYACYLQYEDGSEFIILFKDKLDLLFKRIADYIFHSDIRYRFGTLKYIEMIFSISDKKSFLGNVNFRRYLDFLKVWHEQAHKLNDTSLLRRLKGREADNLLFEMHANFYGSNSVLGRISSVQEPSECRILYLMNALRLHVLYPFKIIDLFHEKAFRANNIHGEVKGILQIHTSFLDSIIDLIARGGMESSRTDIMSEYIQQVK